MRITSLTLKNWRTFKSLELRKIGQRLIVVGPNASGKSNLLDSIRPTPDGTVGHVLADVPDVVEQWNSGIPLSEIVRVRSAPTGVEGLARVNLVAG